VVLLVGLGGLGVWFAGYPSGAYLAVAAGLLLLPALLWRLLRSRAVTVGLEVGTRAVRGEPVAVRVAGGPARGRLRLIGTVVGTPLDRTVRLPAAEWTTAALERGVLRSGLARAEQLGPWGLTRRRLAGPGPVETLVLPRRHPFVSPPAMETENEGPMGTSRGGLEFFGLRPYEDGDDPRLVDPAASARTGDGTLLVRQNVLARTTGYQLVLDPDLGSARDADFETAVDLVYSLACAMKIPPVVSTMVDGRLIRAATRTDAERALAAVRPCLAHPAGTGAGTGGCLAQLLPQRPGGRTTVLVSAGVRAVPAAARAGRLVVFRIGPARPVRRTQAMTVIDTPDLITAARAWAWLGRR
jgi:uncharacterized protein (DUF58 family)